MPEEERFLEHEDTTTTTVQQQQHHDVEEEESFPILRSIVKKIEGIRIGGRQGENTPVPLVDGLEEVVFGTVSAAESIILCGKRPYQYICFMLSGGICDLIQLILDLFLHFVVGIQDASTCWGIGFATSILFRHTMHRYLVFGNYVGGYCNSLLRMYAGYSITIVLLTIFNIFITRVIRATHYVAWIITLLWTGVVNFFILKKLWSFGGGGNNNNQNAEADDSTFTAVSKEDDDCQVGKKEVELSLFSQKNAESPSPENGVQELK